MEQAKTITAIDNTGNSGQRPLQVIPYSEKTPEWYVSNANYYISKTNFFSGNGTSSRKDLYTLYNVYNNQFPLSWFAHITNPLSAKKAENKAFPAKIRPVTILRPNIDLMLAEFRHRPFEYNIENLGDSGYSAYMQKMGDAAKQNLTDHFMQEVLQQAQDSGQQLTPEQMQQLQQEPPLPEQVKEEFQGSYKDALAIKAQKWLNRTVRGHKVRSKQGKMFKDYLIAGEAYSYKAVENDQLIYKRVSPLNIDYSISESEDFVEDGEWVVHREFLTLSDVVDQFYAVLKEENLKKLESDYHYGTPSKFYNFMSLGLNEDTINKVPVYHVQWKGRKKIGFLSYLDMETFQLVEEMVDEDYIVDRDKGEQVEWRWVNEAYEIWKLGSDIYTRMRALPVQRSEMNNLSTCKLSYNGRKYSDTHSTNISVLEIGIPFQIMYIIVTYILEKTIAKSKGKIVLMDVNTIPTENGWDEEKFFYYGEAIGYSLIDRNGLGVDKTWNQYQVLDLSLFDQIKQLIELQLHFKQEWDDILGINRQRKGQTLSSDGQGVNERAAFQSTVMTDMIFLGFEEFTNSDLQGLLDYMPVLTAKGDYSKYNDSDYGTQLLEIYPGEFTMEQLGVFVQDASTAIQRLDEMKQYAQAMIQSGHKPSTVMEIIAAVNVADLTAKLKQIEAIDEQIQQMTMKSEQDAEAAADERKKDFASFQELLDERKTNLEFDRKEDLEYIKGMFNTFTFKDGDSNANGIPDATEVMKLQMDRDKLKIDYEEKLHQRNQKYSDLDRKERELDHKISNDKQVNKLKSKQIKVAAKKKSTAK